MNKEVYLVDTNILVYAYSGNKDRKSELSFELLEDCFDRGDIFAVCLQNLSEFFFVATKHVKNTSLPTELMKIIQDFISFKCFMKLQYDEDTLIRACGFVEKYNADFWMR